MLKKLSNKKLKELQSLSVHYDQSIENRKFSQAHKIHKVLMSEAGS
jgi:hypothetical protein